MSKFERSLHQHTMLQALSKALGGPVSQGVVWIPCPVCCGRAGRYGGRSLSLRLSPDNGWLIHCCAGGCAPSQVALALGKAETTAKPDILQTRRGAKA
jgi:hypothetical protein